MKRRRSDGKNRRGTGKVPKTISGVRVKVMEEFIGVVSGIAIAVAILGGTLLFMRKG